MKILICEKNIMLNTAGAKSIWIFLITMISHQAFANAGEMTVIYKKELNFKPTKEQIIGIVKAKQNLDGSVLVLDKFTKISNQDVQEMLNISTRELTNLWRVKFFTGRAMMPKQVESSLQGIKAVEENTNSLYIHFGSLNEKVPDNLEKKVFTN
jgi:hypothetical protein